MVCKKQTVSFVCDSAIQKFSPKENFFRNIYRFKAVRALVFNPDFRVNFINNALYIRVNGGNTKTIRISHGDFSVGKLVRAVAEALKQNELDDLFFEFTKDGAFEFFCEETGKYKVLNTAQELSEEKLGFDTLTRTLGYAANQEIDVLPRDAKCRIPPFCPAANIYETKNTQRPVDAIQQSQILQWTSLLPHMYREIGRDVNICLNNFACVRTFHGGTEAAPIRAIAKLSLGAPGLPSKRLVSSEMGSKVPFDSEVCIRFLYDDGSVVDDRRGLEASVELLVFHK